MKPEFDIDKSFRQCVGIDISKDKFSACLYMQNAEGSNCRSPFVEFANTKTGFNQLMKWTRKECIKEHAIGFLMEATGIYYEPLAFHLQKLKQTVYVVLPNKARKFAEYKGILTKTDAMDSYVLGWLGCEDRKLKPWTPPKKIYRQLRQMTRFDSAMKGQRTALLNQVEALKHSEMPDSFVIKATVSVINEINRQLEANEKQIKKLIKTDEELEKRIRHLSTIPGVSLITIASIVAETRGFDLITSRKQLASYAGLDIPAHQSGKEDRPRHISKKGNAHIRAALYMPALVATRFNDPLKEDYNRIVLKHATKRKVAIVAIMRKLLLLMYTVWKKEEDFDNDIDKKGAGN